MANPNDPISYDHFETFRGIKIKVPAGVNPTAIKRLPKILDEMLLRCQDTLLARMIERNAAVAIIPKDRYITALPEFASLPEKDENGDDNRSFAVRGKGAVRRQPVTAVAEDDLLQLSLHRPYTESLSHHEIAHAIMNLGFCEAELQEWRGIFEAAKASNRFPGTWMMSKTSDEFWAKLSQTHFGVNDDNSFNSPASIQREDPVAGAFLQRIYGPRQEGH